MSGKTRSFLLSLTIIAVLVFSAFGTTSVYADGGTTTDTPPAETQTSPDGTSAEATSAPEQATAEPAATEVPAEATSAPEEVAPAATEVPAEATAEPATDAAATEVATDVAAEATAAPESTEAAAPAPDATVLDQVPDNTTVTVLDANGQSQPLASEAAAEVLATSDPIWCPAGQNPMPGANGCTNSFTSFDELLTFLSANPTYQGAGAIYVQQGAYQGADPNHTIDFNSYNLSNISGADLTITGGWNSADGTVNSANPSTFNNYQIIIGSATTPWGGSLTLNNITMNFTPQTSPPAVAENGLTLYSQGNINVSNVNVSNAPSAGADLNAGGSVNVINSKFDRNQTAGAMIKSGGTVAVVNSSFSNPANGRRQDTGLDIQSTGAVSLFNVLANENRQVGVNINSGGPVSIGGSVFSGTKVIQGNNNFLGYGLQIVTPGTISIDSVTANDNFLWGASLQGGGAIAISNSIFNANTTASPGFIDDTGLVVHGGSTVALSNVTANDNRLFGATIDATGTVTISNSTFSNNRGTINTGGTTTYNGHGLQVTSLAGIFLANVTADNNMLFGAQLNSGGDVDVSFSTFSNTSTGSSANAVGKGLDIVSNGNVSLTGVVLDNNQTDGATIQTGGNVTLSDVTATNNGANGVVVQGACTQVNGGTFTGNGQYGLNLANSAIDLASAPVFGSNSAGDVFPATPTNCSLIDLGSVPGPTTGTTGVTAQPVAAVGASNIFASLQVAPQTVSVEKSGSVFSSKTNSKNVSLSSFLSSAKTARGGALDSIFFGKYGYTYSSAGMQIVAFAPSFNNVAME